MGRSGPLSETQLRAAIRDLASADESKSCGAACRLCGAAIDANTDIRAAIPALAACAAEPHSTNLVAMWAQQALAACARRGGDIRPAKEALLGRLRESVNHYAADALRAWASRSVAAAAEILEDVKRTIPGDRSLPGKGLTADLEILAKRLMPDAERTWAADRRRGVRVYAGRLLWLTSHGWDQEQVTRITADKAREAVLEKAFQRGETVYWPEDRKR